MMRSFEFVSTVAAAIIICLAITHAVSEENIKIANATEQVSALKGLDNLTKRAAGLLIRALEKEGKLDGNNHIHAASLLRTLRSLEKDQLKKAAPKSAGAAAASPVDVSAFRLRKFAQGDSEDALSKREGEEPGAEGGAEGGADAGAGNDSASGNDTSGGGGYEYGGDYGGHAGCALANGALVLALALGAARRGGP